MKRRKRFRAVRTIRAVFNRDLRVLGKGPLGAHDLSGKTGFLVPDRLFPHHALRRDIKSGEIANRRGYRQPLRVWQSPQRALGRFGGASGALPGAPVNALLRLVHVPGGLAVPCVRPRPSHLGGRASGPYGFKDARRPT